MVYHNGEDYSWRLPHDKRRDSCQGSLPLVMQSVSERDIRKPNRAKVAHAFQDRKKGVALFREAVFDARRHFGEAGATDDARVLKPPQPIRERFRADP